MKKTMHRANTRGHAEIGWLNTWYTFSFSEYYNPERIHFGKLRVLNDDTIAPSMGFGMHPHDNMEVITIPLSGSIKHADNTGSEGVIRPGEVQVMTAGTGIWHSEFNPSDTDESKLLQIWIFPEKTGLKPYYETRSFDFDKLTNNLLLVAGPNGNGQSLKINQQAYIHYGKLDSGKAIDYAIQQAGNGMYLFVIEGMLTLANEELNRRDGLGLEQIESVTITASESSTFVVFEVPMK